MKIAIPIKNADFNQLHAISSIATPSYSFWGIRSIQATGYEGTAPIDSLATRVHELVKTKNFEYTQNERNMGKQIVQNINRIYTTSDKQIANGNLITRIICAIQSFCCLLIYNPFIIRNPTKAPVRWTWDDKNWYSYGLNRVFDLYTAKQYREKFNGNTYFNTYDWSDEIKLALKD